MAKLSLYLPACLILIVLTGALLYKGQMISGIVAAVVLLVLVIIALVDMIFH